MNDQSLDLSVIIACYNEEPILANNVGKILEILDRSSFKYEVILIDDCSKDKTVEIAKEIIKANKSVKLICHSVNMGRGKAVEDGIKAACGKIAGFLDIDLQVPAHYIVPLVMEIEKGADITTALRVYDIRFHMLHRFVISKGYHKLFSMVFKTGIKDSETGFKFFNRKRILPVLDEIKEKHWFWDTEVMVRSYLKGYAITEVPCLCIREEMQKSTVKIFSDIVYYLKNIWRFRKELTDMKREELAGVRK